MGKKQLRREMRRDRRFNKARFRDIERAVIESKANMEHRFTQVNEWRQTYGDLARSTAGEKLGMRNFWGILVAVVMAVIAVAALVWQH